MDEHGRRPTPPDEEAPTVLQTEEAPTVLHREAAVQQMDAGAGQGSITLQLCYVGRSNLMPPDHCIQARLGAEPFIIGRADQQKRLPPGDFEFPAAVRNVSRRHACLLIREGMPALCDLRSVNGTFLNGLRLEPNHYYYIKPGDTIAFSGKGIEYRVR